MGTNVNSRHQASQTREIMDSLRRIVRGLRHSSQQSPELAGLTSAQFFVLQQIKSAGEVTLNGLAERTFTHQSTVSVIVTHLVDLGLVVKEKAENDSRARVISLSRRGRTILAAAPLSAQERLVDAIQSLPVAKRTALSHLLKALVDQAGFNDQPATMFFEEDGEADGK